MAMPRIVAAASALLALQPALAEPLVLPRVEGAVRIDGVIDEAAWSDALRVELEYETDPGENTPAPVRTLARLLEDGRNIYVAFEAEERDPGEIRAWLRDRDSLSSNDYVGISLDTYDDGRRAFEFFANPLGVQLDRIYDDVSDSTDTAWDATWDSAGRIGERGYVVEMRIPLSQLSFQDAAGSQVWRYRLLRSRPRDRGVTLSNSPRDRDRNCSICQYPRLRGLAGSTPGRNLEIVPTLTAVHQDSRPQGVQTNTEAGVTVRYGLTPEMAVNLAVNPDFSQVEADDAEIDINNRFTLSYEEKRPFFLDGADYFRTPLEAVFTRTVASPEVAAKISGKRGANTLAAFVARDEVTQLLFPGPTGSDSRLLEQPNTAFVGRYSRSFAETSSLGALLTLRDGDGYRNRVGGLDARWRLNDRQEFLGQVLESETRYPAELADSLGQPRNAFSGRAISLRHAWETREWFANANYWQVGRGFRADAGFMSQAGSGQQEFEVGRKWYADARWWSRVRLRGVYEIKHRDDGQLLEETWIAGFDVDGPLQSSLDLRLRSSREYESGRYFDLSRLDVSTSFEPLGGLELGFDGRIGDQVDYDNLALAEQVRLEPYVSWNVNRNLFLRVNGSRLALETPVGEPVFDASVLDARLVWHFSLRSYLRLTVQQTDIERNPGAYFDPVAARRKDHGRQLLYSWKLNPQTVFFLGYSDARAAGGVETGESVDRRWFLKVGYGWTPPATIPAVASSIPELRRLYAFGEK